MSPDESVESLEEPRSPRSSKAKSKSRCPSGDKLNVTVLAVGLRAFNEKFHEHVRLVYKGDLKAVCLKDQEDMDGDVLLRPEGKHRVDRHTWAQRSEKARKLSGHWGHHPEIAKGIWDQMVSGDLKVMAKFLRDACSGPWEKRRERIYE